MKNLDPTIIRFMAHYAFDVGAVPVQGILEKRSIDNAVEARAVLDFLEVMCRRVAEDAKLGVTVLPGEKVATYDAEKVCEVVQSHLEELGYGDLLSDE